VRQHIREHGICTTTGDEIDTMLENAIALSNFNEQAGILLMDVAGF
jgi:hypothetical protein